MPETPSASGHSRTGRLARLRQSLGARCLAVLIAYAMTITLLITGVGALGDAIFDNAFPSMRTVLQESDDLIRDRYEVLQSKRFSECLIAVFDGEGRRLFASSDRAVEKIRAADLPLINDYEEGTFYEVFEEREDGALRHRIMLCRYAGPDGTTKLSTAWCVLDEDLNVLEGTLFQGRAALTEREFNFIKGVYDARMSVERYEYENELGEPRTLVLAAPLVSERSYERVTGAVGRLWPVAALLALAATVVVALVLVRVVRRAVRPIDGAIAAYGSADRGAEAPPPAERAGVPMELAPIYENLRYLMRRLGEAQDDYRRLVASVSHDLKTPLTVIRGYAQALHEGRAPKGREDAYLRAILRKSVAAGELLDELSSCAQMNHPEFRARLVPRDIRELVTRAVERAGDQALQAGGTVEAAVGPEPVCALVDEELLERALLNLIGNSFVHNASGTRVRVRCEAERPHGAPPSARVSVLDTGSGFAEGMAERAFSPFVTENVSRREGGGTGLGLTIVSRAAELMGGDAEIVERPEAPWGAEVVIRLPLLEGRDAALGSPDDPGAGV